MPITTRKTERRLVAQLAGIKISILPLNHGCVVREIVVADSETSAAQTTDTLTGRGDSNSRLNAALPYCSLP
jgi:hypothetical protein